MRFHGYHQKIKEIEEMGNAIIQNIKAPVTIESAIYDQKVVEAAY